MILIGQYDSPFVRRVGIALTLYNLPFEHRPWSTFGDAQQIAPFNPLRRVPALVLEGNETLIDSAAILDHLDELAGPRALIASAGPDRRRALRLCALCTGLSDKAVALFYEIHLHTQHSELWLARCKAQIAGVLGVLEGERAVVAAPWFFGAELNHADITLGCTLRHLRDAHPGIFDPALYPALTAHAARCEALPAFQKIQQEFIGPSSG